MENVEIQGRVDYLRVRCPQCFRMYSVNAKEIREPKPRFECIGCKTKFWLAFPECLHHPEVIGFPINWLNPPAEFEEAKKEELKDCPKCQAKVAMAATECPACGIIFEKFNALKAATQVSGPQASRRLRDAWVNVLEEFENEGRHQAFVRACQNEDNMAFALHRYGSFLEAQPTDTLARKMRESVKTLLETKVEIPKRSARSSLPTGWVLLHVFLIGGAILFFAIGFCRAEFRNVMGFGAAFLFFSFGLQFFGNKSH